MTFEAVITESEIEGFQSNVNLKFFIFIFQFIFKLFNKHVNWVSTYLLISGVVFQLFDY